MNNHVHWPKAFIISSSSKAKRNSMVDLCFFRLVLFFYNMKAPYGSS